MSTSWFDLQPEEPNDVVADAVDDSVAEAAEVPVVEAEKSGAAQQRIRRTRGRSRLEVSSGTVWLVAGIVAVVSVVGGIWWMAQDSSDAVPEAVASVSSVPVVTTTVAAKKCPDQPEATVKTADGAFVKFQEAYFAGDAKALLSVVDETSYLADVDWVTAAGEVVGSEFCVKVISAKNNVVDATTTVRTKEGEELAFVQLIRVVRVGDGYRITSIEDKNSPSSIGKV